MLGLLERMQLALGEMNTNGMGRRVNKTCQVSALNSILASKITLILSQSFAFLVDSRANKDNSNTSVAFSIVCIAEDADCSYTVYLLQIKAELS